MIRENLSLGFRLIEIQTSLLSLDLYREQLTKGVNSRGKWFTRMIEPNINPDLLGFRYHQNLPVNKLLFDLNLNSSGLKLRECNENLIFLFLSQNVCCGYSKEPSQ